MADRVAEQYARLTAAAGERDFAAFKALLQAASADPTLGRLYPVSSMGELRFSEEFGRWAADVPFVRTRNDGRYQVLSLGRILIGEADTPQEAVALVVSRLPAGIGPASADPPRRQGRRSSAYYLWTDVKALFDRAEMWSLPLHAAEDRWQRFFDTLRQPDLGWDPLYVVDGIAQPLPPTPFAHVAGGDVPILHIVLPPGMTVTFHLSGPAQTRFAIDTRRMAGQASLEAFFGFLDNLMLYLRTDVLVTLDEEGTTPVVGALREQGTVLLLPASGLF